MKKYRIGAILLGLMCCLTACGAAAPSPADEPAREDKAQALTEEPAPDRTEVQEEQMLKIEVNGHVLYAAFEDNSSADALKEKLKDGAVTLDLHDYGSFEKVGALPWKLPKNDTQITTQAGDVILYQGNQITIYYDVNSWNFTRMAKIQDVAQDELKQILGDGNVTVVLSTGKKAGE